MNAQRLRAGGRADQALRSAINSSIRQGYLAREGAAYLVRVAQQAEPSLRGMLPSGSPELLTPENKSADAEPAAVEPSVSESDDKATQHTEALQNEPPPQHVTLAEPLSEEGSSPTPDFTAQVVATAPTAAGSNEAPALLDHNLWQLDLPTRTLNWAERQGIHTVRELVAWLPETFAVERNVGRRTVRETRERLDSHLGCTCEEARLAARSGTPAIALETAPTDEEAVDSATEALTAGGSTGWAAVATSLTDEQRALPLLQVPLPTRMKNFVRAQGLLLLGELFRGSYTTLAAQENIGRKSLNDTLDTVRDFLSERASPTVYPTFREAWQAQLSALEPIPRMIVTRRAGMHGTRETLEELGGMLGVSRERVRQIETHMLERVRERGSWRRSFEANVSAAFGAARAIPLHLLAQDPWWAGIDQEELLLDYVVRRVFEDELFLLQAPSGKRYLSKFPQSELDERLDSARARIAKLGYPVEMSVIDAILRAEADALDPVLFAELEGAFAGLLHVDADKPGLALGYGRYRDDEILAFLNGQDAPVPVAVIEERFGRGRPPEEVLYFKRGL
ncbi:MAG TPA: DNA-directed RNA polymerase subunit alpha C-terminal domain-containing protein, partial [Polyangiaceae bacterium]|nr:DNA-directed RNA polymerase subunit alpha C-terminal domain-containing protein [Polyangiaceae bacterium]